MPALVILTAGVLFFGALNYCAGRIPVPPQAKYRVPATEMRAIQRRIAPPALALGVVMAVILSAWAVIKYL